MTFRVIPREIWLLYDVENYTIVRDRHDIKYDKLKSLENRPSIIWHCKSKDWYRNGVLHRDGDGPAIINNFSHFQTINRW